MHAQTPRRWFACKHCIFSSLQNMDHATRILQMGPAGIRDLYVSSPLIPNHWRSFHRRGRPRVRRCRRVRRLPQDRTDTDSRRDRVLIHPGVQPHRHPRARGGTHLQPRSADEHHRAQVDPHRRAHSKPPPALAPARALTSCSPSS